ncbi:hypothetical protein ABZ342_20415 [Amycolatopsis sp. NPDC005961]|uniref:Cap15 family cyclic dinucleotide receptor domain-containing protein n=1 Tax=Amycolatopsis sp. NPDC005961 TaxID=3156720 RepID=UPI0033D41B9F
MIDKTQTKVVIGLAAVVWFCVALLSNGPLPQVALKSFSIAGTVATILVLAYDKFIWKWKFVRAVTGKPLVAGTWRGTLQSDFIRPGETEKIPPMPTVIRVKQTNSQLWVTLFTATSSSVTEQGKVFKESDDRWRMSFIYMNTPRQSEAHNMARHQGVCDLHLSGADGEALTGQYFTSRKTTGEMRFTEWSKHSFGDAQSALESTDFKAHKPFVRWFS